MKHKKLNPLVIKRMRNTFFGKCKRDNLDMSQAEKLAFHLEKEYGQKGQGQKLFDAYCKTIPRGEV